MIFPITIFPDLISHDGSIFKYVFCFSRLDTTLVDFTEMRWERGDITFMFNGEAEPNHSLTVLDNKAEVFQRVRYEVCIGVKVFYLAWWI